MNIEGLKVQKHFNYTLGEETYKLTGEVNGIIKVIETYETKQEALAGKHAIENLMELMKE